MINIICYESNENENIFLLIMADQLNASFIKQSEDII